MKSTTKLILAFALLLSANGLFAQGTLEKTVELAFTMDGGTNGCSVAFDPSQNLYYANFAGNEAYPLETFNLNGVSKHSREMGFDSRGIWYNPKSKQLEGTAYGGGLYKITRNSSGFPLSSASVTSAPEQSGLQSVGTYDSKKKAVIFYNEGSVYFYDTKTGKSKGSLSLKSSGDLNYTSVVYTGIKGKEFGLLDYDKNEVMLFNRKGELVDSYKLPSGAITNSAFRFSYANNLVFLYDVDTRTWTGYKGLK